MGQNPINIACHEKKKKKASRKTYIFLFSWKMFMI